MTIRVAWSPIERATPYVARFNIYEQDSGFRGSDDFLEVFDIPIPDTDKPVEDTYSFTRTGTRSWNNEWGSEEIYANVILLPAPEDDLPRVATARTNVISAKFP